MAYPVLTTAATRAALTRLPDQAREALTEALLGACQDPWAIPRYDETTPPHIRLLAWPGGTATLLIDEQHPDGPALVLLAITT